MMKRVLSFIMSMVMVLTMLPLQAMAVEISAEETVVPVETEMAPETTAVPETTVPVTTAADETAFTEAETTVQEEIIAEPDPEAVWQEPAYGEESDYTYTVLNGTYCEITGYTGTDTELTVPSAIGGYIVQSIANNAFKNNTTITAVTLPDTIETMGTGVFYGCTALTDVQLYEGLAIVGAETFRNCTSLESITLPSTVTSIGSNAFAGCTALTGIALPAAVTRIGQYAFRGCTALKEITLNEGLTTICSYAFENCTSLETIDLPDSVSKLAARAFYNCTKLSEVNYPAGWTTVLNYENNTANYSEGSTYYQSPFQGCTALTKIGVPEGVTAIPKYAFRNMSALEEVTLPETLTTIGAYAFDCSGLKSITLPESLTTIGSYGFATCKNLTAISLPETVATIGSYGFAYSSGLTEMTLPDSVTSLGEHAFRDCTGLTKVTVGSGVTKLSRHTFYGCSSLTEVNLPDTLTTIYSYAFENCTALECIDIPDSVMELGARAFYNCTKLSEVGCPAGWTAVLNYENNTTSYSEGSGYYQSPFQGCTALKKIEVPEGGTTIPKYAFRNVSALAEVTLPETLTTISAYAFEGSGLKSMTLPDSVTAIGTYGFAYNSGLTEVTLPDSLTALGEHVFRECTGLRKVTVGSGLTKISRHTFYGCTGLTEVTLPETLTTIYSYAFENCTSLESIDIPDSVTTLGARAFYNCTRLSEVGYPAGWTTVLNYDNNTTNYSEGSGYYQSPFQGCTALKRIEVPEGVTAIPKYAFRGCTGLEEAILSDSVTTIQVYAFSDCTKMEKIWLGETVTTIGTKAFENCSALTIHGVEGSYAQTYAESNSIPFSAEPLVYPTSAIGGKVQDGNGAGVAGVAVTVYDVTWNEALDTLTTDANGQWSSEDVIIGHTYRISFYHPEYTLSNSSQTYTITEAAMTAQTVIAEAKTEIPGTAVEDFTYTVLNGTYCQLTGYTGEATAIRIPAEINGYIVQSIANNAFKNNTTITAVVLPDTIETMGTGVFYGCTALTDVRLNEGLTKISNETFRNCTSLESITLPNAVTSIGAHAFNGCTSMTEITLSSAVASIGNHAFSGCTALEEVTLSEGLTTIYSYAFEKCTSLESIDLPDSVTRLASRAFYNCTKLSEVGYPAGWTAVLDYEYNSATSSEGAYYYQSPFQGCTALTKIEVPEGVAAIPKYGFRNMSALEEVTLPETLTTIGAYAFDCSGLKSITLPESLTTIGSYGFATCKNLTALAIPEAMTKVGSYGFAYSSGLTEMTIPDSVTSLGEHAFRDCTGLTKVTLGSGVTKLSRHTFYGCSSLTEVTLPDTLTTIYSYAFEKCTSLESIDIPDSVTELGARAFYNCTKLSEVGYPADLTTILDYDYNSGTNGEGGYYYQSPFQGCTALKKIEVPEGVTTIPKHTFRNVSALTEVTLPETVTTIGTYAFAGTGLKTVTLPDTVVSIGKYGFANSSGLTEVILPDSLTSLGEHAFRECTGLKKLMIGNGMTEISRHTFYGCTGLTEVVLPDTLTTIYSYAFENCTSLETLDIPDSVTTLGARAFYNCTKLQEVGYPAGWTTVLDYEYNSATNSEGGYYYQSPFQGCTALKRIEVPEGVTAIPKHAFRNVSALEKVILSDSVTTIQVYAFSDCTKMEKIWLGETVTTIGTRAFENCSALTIHGVEGSYAQSYAEANSIPFSTEPLVYPTSSIEGKVQDSNGAGIAGVAVTVYDVTWNEKLETLATDENGQWSSAEVIIGHEYQIRYYHPDYTLSNSTQTVTIGEEAITAQTVIAEAKTEIPETAVEDFTYTVLNGSYCQLTGYTGEATAIRIPSEINGYIVQSIADNAFKNNKTITAVVLPDTIETMGTGVFYGCTALTDVRLNEGLTKISNEIFRNCTSLESITLPNAVTSIGAHAFNGCTSMTEITLSSGVASIGSNAFAGCTALTGITLPAAVTSIGQYAFRGCTALKEITLNEGLTTICSYAFENCTSLETIAIPDSVSKLAARAFYNCTKLSEVNLSAGWTTVLNYENNTANYSEGSTYYQSPFQGCAALTKIEVPEGVTAIPKYGFRNMSALDEVTLPETVTTIGAYAFEGSGLKNITLPESLTTIGNYGFASCKNLTALAIPEALTKVGSYGFAYSSGLTEMTIPDSVTSLGEYAFRDCTGLTKVTLGSGVTKLSRHTFYGCTGLTEVVFPDTLTTIYSYAFENCTSMETIDIPDSVTELGARAFYNCTKLNEVGYPAGWTTVLDYDYNSATNSEGGYYYQSPFQGCTALKKIEVPEGVTTIPKYAFRNVSVLEEVTLPETLTTISAYAFEGSGLKSMTLPDSVTAIGTYGFAYNSGLTEVTLPDSLTALGEHVFRECTGLRKVTVGSGLTKLSRHTFYGCTGLTEVTLPDTLTTIYSYAFENCTSLESIDIPDSVTTLGARAFYNCTRLSEVGYPAGWTTVLNYENNTTNYSEGSGYYQSPFQGCTALKRIEVTEGVTAIPKYAFRNCTGLEEVTFPGTLQTIGVYAFDGCTNLRIVEFNEGLTAIPACAFQNCTSLAVVEIPSSVTAIGNYAFYNCIGLRVVQLGSGVKTIGESAFYGCDGLLSLVLNDGLTTIGNNAFNDCENLQSVEIPASVESIQNNSFSNCDKLTVYCYSGSQAHMVGEAAGLDLFILDEHEHDYTTKVETTPDCTRDGSQIKTCSICNYYYIEILDARGHIDGSWIALNKPTCTEEGIRIQKCFVCEEEIARDYIPAYGHKEGDWVVAEGSCEEGGFKTKTCITCNAEVEREAIPANGHDWSEWIVESVPSVLCQGVTYRTCSICQKREEIIQEKLNVDYTTNRDYGLVHLTVVNAGSLEPVANAGIFISTENDGEATIYTGADGTVSQVLPVGTVKLSVLANGYQARNISITVEPGENEIPQIGISNGYLVEGKLTSKEMTYEDMIAAGIDVNNPSNQHLFKYALVLEFVPGIDWLSLGYYIDANGLPYITGWEINPSDTSLWPPPYDDGEYDDDNNDDDDGPGYWELIYEQVSEGGGGGGRRPAGIRGELADGKEVSVYPINEKFYLIIYGEVHWLKEMYDVELLAINNSMTDTVENLEAELTLPYGLSLAKMVGEQQSPVQQMGTLDYGESKSVHWYVRGDVEGTYSIAATLRGNMLPFGDPFEHTFEAQDPIKVYAGSAMHLTYKVEDSAFYGQPYTVQIELENVSDKTLYDVTHAITDIDQFRVTEYSNGMVEVEEYPVTGGTGSIFIPEFRPGDKVFIEVTTTIMFQSKLIQYQKDQLKNFISGVKQLVNAMNAVETGLGMVDSVTAVIGGSITAMDSLTFIRSTPDSAKVAQAKLLSEELSELKAACGGKLSTDSMQTMSALTSSGLLEELETISSDPAVLDQYSAKDLESLNGKLKSIRTDSQMARTSGQTYDAYEAIMAIIDLIPVRFHLTDSWVATLEGSTTEIPYTIVVNPVGPKYFGIDNMTSLLVDTVIMAVGENVGGAWEILTGDFKENIGYYDAAERVATQINNAHSFKVTGTGGSTFRAWVAPASAAYAAATGRTAGVPDFELAIDNDTGVMENGVLTFSGSGILTATPNSMVPGVLCVEMEDGTVKRYTIDVVEEHSCSASQWTVVNAPAAGMDGLRVKYCDVCDDMIELENMTVCSEHEFGEFVTVLEPTMDTAGKKISTCAHCGAESYEFIDALGMNQYVTITAEARKLVAGEKTTLTAAVMPEGDTAITWSLDESSKAFATLKPNGSTATLTAKAVTQKQTITVIATAEDAEIAEGRMELVILPKATAVAIFSGEEDVTNGTLSLDLNSDNRVVTLTAEAIPGDAKQEFQWSSSNEKVATVADGVVTFTGADGKAKVTAMVQDGSKKAASVNIETVRVPHNVEKEDEVEGEADLAILGGKSRALVVYDKDTGKALTAKQITWSMDEKYAAYASVDAKGKVKTQKVVTVSRIEVMGAITGSTDDPVVYIIDVYPAVSHLEILKDAEVVNGQTVYMTGDTLTLSANIWPLDAMQGITWTNPDAKKQTYAQYTENADGSLTISAPTGKAGTLSLKATSSDGSKKSATVKVQFGIVAETLTIDIPMIQSVRSGGTLSLTAQVTPEKVTKPGIIWSLADNADSAYATVSNGKVKAKNVTENHYVTINAVTKDGCARDSITVLVMPKEEETLILKSGEAYLTGRTRAMDSSAETTLELSAWLLGTPEGAQIYEAPQSVSWKSSKPEIASVSAESGERVTVTLHQSGTAAITAVDDLGRKATVTIKGSVLVDTLSITVKETANLIGNHIEVASGKSVTLLAVTNADAANKKATWTILEGDEYVTITKTGKLTANKDLTSAKPVKVEATAADGSGKTAEAIITFRPIAQGVQVYTIENGVQTFTARSNDNWWVRNNTTASWDLTTQGRVITLNADVYPFYGQGDDRNAMQAASWKSSAPKVADFLRDENGDLVLADGNVQLICHTPGSTSITVTAEDGSKQKVSFKLNIVQHVGDFDLEPQILASGKSLNLAKLLRINGGEGTTTKKFAYAITGGNGAAYATISSSGTLKAKNVPGHVQVNVMVTALDVLGHSETFTVDLYPATTKVQLFRGSEEVTGQTLTLAAGESLQLTASCEPAAAANIYNWTSQKSAVVFVDETGLVTTLGESGTVTITCTAADGSGKKATVKIKIG